MSININIRDITATFSYNEVDLLDKNINLSEYVKFGLAQSLTNQLKNVKIKKLLDIGPLKRFETYISGYGVRYINYTLNVKVLVEDLFVLCGYKQKQIDLISNIPIKL